MTSPGSAEVIGYAALQIIPSIRGVEGALGQQLSGPLQSAGRAAGVSAGRAVAQGMEQAKGAVEAASSKLAAARDKEADAAGKLRVAETRLQELRDSGRASASQLARAEEAVEAARRRADRATDASRTAVNNLAQARARLANATREEADATDEAEQSQGRFASAVSNLTDRLGPATRQMAASAAAAAGIGSAMALAGQAMENAKLNDKLAAQLGAGPEMAAEFGGIAGRLYANAYGENLGQVNDALKNVWQQGLVSEDATTAEIEGVTASVLDLATAMDQDVPAAAAAIGTILKNNLAPDAQTAMDLLTRGFQQGADKGGDLLDTFIEYPALFQRLGLSADDAMGILSQGLSAGAFNADKVADAMKEFQIRATDGSTSSAEAFKLLGLNAEEMTAQFAAGGEGAAAGLDMVLDRLRGMTDPVQQNAAAVGLFGTQAEDLGASLFAIDPSSAVQSLGQVDGAAAAMSATLNDNAATAFESLKRTVQGELTDGLGQAAMWIDRNREVAAGLGITLGVLGAALVTAKVAAMGYAVAQGVMAAATGAGSAALAGNSLALGAYAIATGVARGATLAWSAGQWVLNAALSANPIGLVVVAIGALVAGLVYAWQNSETFRDIVIGVWDAIKVAALWTWDNVLKPVIDWIVNGYKMAWDAAKAAGDGIAAAWQRISDKATDAKDWVVNAFNTVVDFVGGLPGRVRDAASGLWDSIKDSFRSAINWLISAWNHFRLGFDFEIPVINKRVTFEVNTPDLPLLAGGGIAGRTPAGTLFGPGTGTSDSILGIDARTGLPTAFVSAGEGVVSVAAMSRGGAELVAALNAGWVPPLDMLRAMLPGLAAGGLVEMQSFAKGEAGKPYQYGGTGNPSWDCSAIAGAMWAIAVGKEPRARHFTTEADFAAFGFQPGLGGPNDLSIGTNGGSGTGGHMAATVGTMNVESSGSDGVEVGAAALGAADLAQQWHMAIGGDPGGALTPGSALGGGNLSGAGTSGGGGNSGGSGGSTSGGSTTGTRPPGDAVPVWIDGGNWPSNFGGSSSTTTPTTTPGGTGVDSTYTTDTTTGTGATATTEQQAHPLAQAGGLLGELSDGPAPWWMAATPEQAAANLGTQAASLAAESATGFKDLLSNNWKEMLQTGAALVGMGAGMGGGDTYNIIGPDPRQAAMAIDRVNRRRTMAARRTGGLGR